LVLACWQGTEDVTALVERYNGAYPEMQIQIKEYYNSDIDVDDALTRMNAELVAGKQADLYCFGSMDLQRLLNSGLVADLMPYVEADPEFTEDNYYMNILEMFQQGTKLYEIPCFFQLAGICLPSSYVPDGMTGWTVQEYIDFDNTLKQDGKTVLSMEPQMMMEFLSQYSIDAYISQDLRQCQFENQDFYQLLNFARDNAGGNGGDPIGMGTWVMGLLSYADDIQTLGEQPNYVGYPDAAGDGPCVMSLVSFGISSSTAHPEACWEFMKVALSDDAYLDSGLKVGFPLSKSALDKAIQAFQWSTEDERSPIHGLTDQNGDYYVPLEDGAASYVYELLDSVTHARFRYRSVCSIINDEASAFLESDKSAEETAALIQNRVSILLSEQE
jgi:multiple sugar transport system substrate-binding protein